MRNRDAQIDRRQLLAGGMVAAAGWPLTRRSAAQQPAQPYSICAFIKFLQSLSYDQLAETIAELGFDGIEATVRRRGHVDPQRVEEDLPKLVEALNRHDLEITVMASDVNQVDPLNQRVLKTASQLGVRRFRMGSYRYDQSRPILKQLQEIRPKLRDLVQFSRQLDMTALYQNHSGANYVGAVIWDLHQLIKDYPVEDVGIAFDIRHATVEGGLSWITHFNLMQPHLGPVYVKDFKWAGRKPQNVPLGDGQVDPRFFQLLARTDFQGPISLHVEYLPDAGVGPNIDALRDDLATLRQAVTG